LVERFFNKIKQCRRVATRSDELATNVLAFIQLASIRLWLRVDESTPLKRGASWRPEASERSHASCPFPTFSLAISANILGTETERCEKRFHLTRNDHVPP